MRCVVDASAFVDAILPTPRQSAVLSAMSDAEMWAPPVFDMEVVSALWRLVRTGQITDDEADYGLDLLRTSTIRRVDHPTLIDEAWRLRQSVRISDAFYVSAAKLLDAALMTADARLSRTPGLGVTVVLIQ
ncbi:MAG: type II toxin-antitoxin system VapC family toxin [Gordonia sp. (in: high G+C Gram-positive bacteria)]|uniref:type II toxin-antitoxin system VapC family toxin n=1 Tax=Gordonia sp. (in: high G+C Gram-positive bacteria) TaxID=84139 RepID=UPI0039E4FFC5